MSCVSHLRSWRGNEHMSFKFPFQIPQFGREGKPPTSFKSSSDMSQPLLVLVNHLCYFSTLARSWALIWRMQPISMISSPYRGPFFVDIDGHLIYPNQTSLEEVMHVLIYAVPRGTLMPLLFHSVILRQCPTQIAISSSPHLQLRCSWAFKNSYDISYT